MKHSQIYLQQSSSHSHQGCGLTTVMKQKDPMPRPKIMQAMSARTSSGWSRSSTNATAKRS